MSLAKKVYKEKNNWNSADFLALHLMSIHPEWVWEGVCIWCSALRRSSLVLLPLESGHLSVLGVILPTHLLNKAPKTTVFTTRNFCRKHWFQNLSLGKRLWLYLKELDPCICDDGVSQNYQNLTTWGYTTSDSRASSNYPSTWTMRKPTCKRLNHQHLGVHILLCGWCGQTSISQS